MWCSNRVFMGAASPPGLIVDADGQDLGQGHGVAVLFQHFLGLIRVVDDEAQDAEVVGIRHGEGADIDAGLGQKGRDLRQTARLVFHKYRNLFDNHTATLSLVVKLPFIDDADGLALASGKGFGLDQRDLRRDS